MQHAYIKPVTPRLNGKMESSQSLTDQREFYQCLEYKDDADLVKKTCAMGSYYNYLRHHTGHMGKTPYEKLKQRMLE